MPPYKEGTTIVLNTRQVEKAEKDALTLGREAREVDAAARR